MVLPSCETISNCSACRIDWWHLLSVKVRSHRIKVYAHRKRNPWRHHHRHHQDNKKNHFPLPPPPRPRATERFSFLRAEGLLFARVVVDSMAASNDDADEAGLMLETLAGLFWGCCWFSVEFLCSSSRSPKLQEVALGRIQKHGKL